MATDPRITYRWVYGSLVWTVLVSTALALLPIYTGQTCIIGGSCVSTRATLLEVNGPSAVIVLLAPIILPVLGLLAGPWRRSWLIGLGVGYLLLVALAILSIGAFYLPAAVALLMAGVVTHATPAVHSRP